jgi:tRNA pseudouridine13 synthase|tara:strand:- start:731 stop:2125 length:1395 start_codon:yes stop_codon:yes gene_type:complete
LTEGSLEERLGLSEWVSPNEGIGGILKSRVEDFRVEEISKVPALDPKGRFTVTRITMVNWETNRFLKRLSSACGISRNRVFTSGMKDKRAVTTQIVVIDAPVHKVEKVKIPDSTIEILGRTHQKVGMSDHDGNRFTITIRGCCDLNGEPLDGKEAMKRVNLIRTEMAHSLGADAFPNWIGPQRFGSTRPVTPEVGRAIVDGDYKKAVDLYLGMEGKNPQEEVQIFRKLWRDTSDIKECLNIIPDRLGYERNILERLAKKPEDYRAAFMALPNSLQLLTIHSVQSLTFNYSLRERLKRKMPIIFPTIGDIVAPVHPNGRIDATKMAYVSETNLERCKRNCVSGRLAVTGPLPGLEAALAKGIPGEVENIALKQTNLDGVDWRIERIPRLTSSGTRRPLSVFFKEFSVSEATEVTDLTSGRWIDGTKEGDRWHPEGACLRLKFALPPGTYATVLMREFMRSPLDHY